MAPGPDLTLDVSGKRFAGVETPLFGALHLAVPAGTTLAIVGASGAGKSSLLRMVAGIDTDFAGQIRIAGVPAAAAPAPGLVFQDARLLPWLSVRDNLTRLTPGLGEAEAEALLAQVGLTETAQDYPYQLSGGMQRRAALARALAANPRLLLLDEPFVSLEPVLAGEMRGLVRDVLAGSGATCILVTHALEDAAWLADRVVLLAGRPAQITAALDIEIPISARGADEIAAIVQRLEAMDRIVPSPDALR